MFNMNLVFRMQMAAFVSVVSIIAGSFPTESAKIVRFPKERVSPKHAYAVSAKVIPLRRFG